MGDRQEFSCAAVIRRLPDSRDPEDGDELPVDLLGARILDIGTGHIDAEGGGLIIDYAPIGCTEPRRLVLAFNELGMWVVWPHQTD